MAEQKQHNKALQGRLYSAVGVAVVAVLLIIVYSIFQNSSWRLDCTQDKVHTFSDATLKVLGDLKQNVSVKFYYSKDVAEMPVVLKNYAARVEDMLREYEIHGKGHIRITKLNPKPDTDAEDSANLDGIAGQSGDALGIEDNIYLGVAISCADHTETLPFLSPEKENLLEYELTRAIIAVTNPVKHKLGVMSAMKVFGGIDNPAMMMQGQGGMKPAWLIITELKKMYDTVEVPLTAEEIPADIDMLLLIHPRDISDETQFALDQFVLRGGRLLALVDPLCLADMQNQPREQMQYMPPNASSNLDKLFKAWGVQFNADEVVLDRTCATVLRQSQHGPAEQMPNVLSLTEANVASGDPATTQISSIIMLNAGSFSGPPADGLAETVLLKSSKDSQCVEKYMTQRQSADMLRDFRSDESEKKLAIRLTGTFKTAFPDGKPAKADANKDEKKDAPKPAPQNFLKESVKPGAVVLVADADLLYDPFCVRQNNIFGQTFYQPINHNLALTQNLVESMSGDVALFQIRSRGVRPRPFTRVRDMEVAASERYRSEIQKFEGEVANFQRELREMQRNRKPGDKELLSRAQKDAVARIQKKQAEARRNLKEVRKQQRRDVEALENRVMIANIAVMPLLVVIGGIVLAIVKRVRRTAK